MRFSVVRWYRWLILCSSIWLVSCSAPQRVSYPEYFVWLEADQLHSVMHEFATGVRVIDAAAAKQRPSSARVIGRELDSMAAIARRYGANRVAASSDSLVGRHERFNEKFDEFLGSLERLASRFDANPDHYYQLGKLTGLCTACHKFR